MKNHREQFDKLEEIYVKKTHKHRPKEDWVREHIIIIENHINRRLEVGEVVHQYNGIGAATSTATVFSANSTNIKVRSHR